MSTIDKDSDIYKGGSGGLDPENLPDDPNLMLSTGNLRTAGKVEKGWLQVPIAYSDSVRYWFLNLKKTYDNSDGRRPPVWFVANSSYQLKTISLELDLVAFYNNANHQEEKHYLLLNVDKFVNSDSGKYLRIKKVFGINTWDIEFVDLPTPESSIFEVYIDENNAANNRNVVYNDIVAAINAGKHVYLKTLDSRNEYHFYDLHVYDPAFKSVSFGRSSRSVFQVSIKSYWIDETNSYGSNINTLYTNVFQIDESVSPVYISPYFSFASMKDLFNKGDFQPVILKYKNSSGNTYKLEAVKLTATEIMFSVYDPDTARNLSIVVNDQDQYTVIT